MTVSKLFFYFILFCCSVAHAEPLPQWNIVPAQSSITFTGSQNNAPVTGTFKSFTGTIYADPSKYQESNITIIVAMNSLSVTYAELATILITPEWFNVKAFPKAEFKSTKFNKINDTTYEAIGTFTIKNKSVPAALTFTAKESPKNHIIVEGHTVIKRLAFGIGEGEWESTDVIKDDVSVTFKIAAERKK
jgi:polyisoprenoid-binding protein YceI